MSLNVMISGGEESANIFNKDNPDIEIGFRIETNGTIKENEKSWLTHYIPITLGNTYLILYDYLIYGDNGRRMAFYNLIDGEYVYLGTEVMKAANSTKINNNYYINRHIATKTGYVRLSYHENASYASIENRYMFLENVGEDFEYPLTADGYIPYGMLPISLNREIEVPQVDDLRTELIEYIDQSVIDENKVETTIDEKLQNVKNTTSKLYKKTILWVGDSITAAETDETALKGWSGRIAQLFDGTYVNYAVSGATITKGLQTTSGSEIRSICTRLENLITNNIDGDYVIMSGGHNDADWIGDIDKETKPAKFGSYDLYLDFDGQYDTTTFCGALETMIYKAITHYKGKKIGFVLVHRDTRTAALLKRRKLYHEETKNILRKWGIPFVDLWELSYINCNATMGMYDSSITQLQNREAGNYFVDGLHLSAAGYDLLTPIIVNFLESL